MTEKGDRLARNMAMNQYTRARYLDAISHIFLGAGIAFFVSLGYEVLAGWLSGPLVDVTGVTGPSTHLPGWAAIRMAFVDWQVPVPLLLLLLVSGLLCFTVALKYMFMTHRIVRNAMDMIEIDTEEGGKVFGTEDGGETKTEAVADPADPPADERKV